MPDCGTDASARQSRRLWAAADTTGPGEPLWVQVVAQGNASRSSLYVYLQSAGDLSLDDLRLVPGSVTDVGPNSVQNGDFEPPLSGPWVVSPNHAASALSTTIKRSGSASLHLVAGSGGTTRASSIYQELSPALVSGEPYTPSFWYRQSTNGGPLTFRLSGHGITVTVDSAPTVSGPYTPGAADSVARVLAPFPPLWLNEVQPLDSSGPAGDREEREPWIELFNAGPATASLDGLFLANHPATPGAWAFPTGLAISPGQCLLLWADADPADNRFQDWFELYNPGERAVSLQDWYLSDVTTNQFKFRIPAGYSLPPRGLLLVWADEEAGQNQPDRPGLHVNFRLSQDPSPARWGGRERFLRPATAQEP